MILQAFKELITAIIGIIIVVITIKLAWETFNLDGTGDKVKNAKDILLLMLGLAGVVLGYYFGRMPADARASQAQVQANDANAKAEYISAQARVIADKVEKIAGSTRGDSDGSRSFDAKQSGMSVTEELNSIRDELNSLANTKRL
jgi:hypothetical protein